MNFTKLKGLTAKQSRRVCRWNSLDVSWMERRDATVDHEQWQICDVKGNEYHRRVYRFFIKGINPPTLDELIRGVR